MPHLLFKKQIPAQREQTGWIKREDFHTSQRCTLFAVALLLLARMRLALSVTLLDLLWAAFTRLPAFQLLRVLATRFFFIAAH
jgi:hypothetical protein